MELEIIRPPSPPQNFNFSNHHSGRSTPSSPKAFGGDYYFLSAPASPTRASDFYREFEEFSHSNYHQDASSLSQPASPGRAAVLSPADHDFTFQVNVDEISLLPVVSAHELFDGGRIRPSTPMEAKTDHGKKKSAAFWEAIKPSNKKGRHSGGSQEVVVGRGREVSKSGSRRAARSLSPHRDWVVDVDDHHHHHQQQKPPQPPPPARKPTNPAEPPQGAGADLPGCLQTKTTSRRWRLKDFLLFRSASEGRASDKDPLRKYSTLFYRKLDEKTGSFRSTDKDAGGGSVSKRRSMVSAHEMHYATNKAVSDDRKKKTFLPYKERILGRFPF